MRECDRITVDRAVTYQDIKFAPHTIAQQPFAKQSKMTIRDPYQLSLLQWKVVADHLAFCSEQSLPPFLSGTDTDTKAEQMVDDCFKIVDLFRKKPEEMDQRNAPGNADEREGADESVSGGNSCEGGDSIIDDGADESDGDDETMHAKITEQNDASQTWRWLFPFMLCGIFFVMLFFAATWHADAAFPWDEDPASEFYTLTKKEMMGHLELEDEELKEKSVHVKMDVFVRFLNAVSERWFWNEDTSSAVRIGLLKIALKLKKSSTGFCVDSDAVNSSASYNSTTARGADNSNSCAPSLSPQYAIALGDKQVWQNIVDVQNASSFPLFESAELKFTLYSHSAKSLLHCHFHFRNVATGDVAVQQKFTQLHSTFPWEEKQWYSSTMNLLFLPAVLCMSLVP